MVLNVIGSKLKKVVPTGSAVKALVDELTLETVILISDGSGTVAETVNVVIVDAQTDTIWSNKTIAPAIKLTVVFTQAPAFN